MLDEIDVVEAANEIEGYMRAYAFKIVVVADLFQKLAMGTHLTGFAANNAAADGDIPEIRPAFFEGLTLLDEHLTFGVEDANVNHQMIFAFVQRLSTLVGFT